MNKMLDSKFWTSSFKKLIVPNEEDKKFRPLRKLFSKALGGDKTNKYSTDVRMSSLKDEFNRTISLQSVKAAGKPMETDLYPISFEESFSHLYETITLTESSSSNTSPRISGIYKLPSENSDLGDCNGKLPSTSSASPGKESGVFVGDDDDEIHLFEGKTSEAVEGKSTRVYVGEDEIKVVEIGLAAEAEKKPVSKKCIEKPKRKFLPVSSPKVTKIPVYNTNLKSEIQGLNTSTPFKRIREVPNTSSGENSSTNIVKFEDSSAGYSSTPVKNVKISVAEVHSPPDTSKPAGVSGIPVRKSVEVTRKTQINYDEIKKVEVTFTIGEEPILKKNGDEISEVKASVDYDEINKDEEVEDLAGAKNCSGVFVLKKSCEKTVKVDGAKLVKAEEDLKKDVEEDVRKVEGLSEETRQRKSVDGGEVQNVEVLTRRRNCVSKRISELKKNFEPSLVPLRKKEESVLNKKEETVLDEKEESPLKKIWSVKNKCVNFSPVKFADKEKRKDKPLSFRSKIRIFEPNYKRGTLIERQKKEEKVRVLNKHKLQVLEKHDVAGGCSSDEHHKKDRHRHCLESNFYAKQESELSFFDKRAKPMPKVGEKQVSLKKKESLFKKRSEFGKRKPEGSDKYKQLAKIGARCASGYANLEESPQYKNQEVLKTKREEESPSLLRLKTSLGYIPKWKLEESQVSNLNKEELVDKKWINLSPAEVEFLKKQKEISNRNAAVNDIIESSLSDPLKIFQMVKAGAKTAKGETAKRSLTFPRRVSDERLEAKKLVYEAAKELFTEQCQEILNKKSLIPKKLQTGEKTGEVSPVREKIAFFEQNPSPTYSNTKHFFLDEFGQPISPIVKEKIQQTEDRFVVNIFESRKCKQDPPKLQPDNAKIIRISDKENDSGKQLVQLVREIQDANVTPEKILANSIARKQKKFENSPPLQEIFNRMEFNHPPNLANSTLKDQELTLTPEVNGEEPIYSTPVRNANKPKGFGHPNNDCETFLRLKQEVDIQGNVMKQASKALEYCKGSSVDIYSLIEAEKILLAATCRYELLMEEIRKDHYRYLGNVGTVEISSMRIGLRERKSREWYVVILSQEDKIFNTRVIEASPTDHEINFDDFFVFEKLHSEFKIKIRVFSFQDRRKFKESKFTFNKKVSTLCGKSRKLRYKDLQTSTMVESSCATSSFEALGSLEVSIKDITTREIYTFNDMPATSSLSGVIMLAARVAGVQLESAKSGFLNVGVEGAEGIVWNRRWCVLSGSKLSLWNYPNEEGEKPPEEVMDLIHCTGAIRAAERKHCPKPRSLKVGTLKENCEQELVHYLNADGLEDFNAWEFELNNVFDTLEYWKVLDNRRSTCL